MAANGDPGAPELPDITTCYPQIAVSLERKGLLVDLDEYFTARELSSYVAPFVEEGKIDDGLYVFPIAKSTEVLFINETLFDRFAQATGATHEDLGTFEGIAQLSQLYYEWAGKPFFVADSLLNVMLSGMYQLGDSFVCQQSLNTYGMPYEYIFETLFEPSVKGAWALYDGYSSDLSKTGDVVCSIGSSAGILFYGDTITYDDNTTETVEFSVMPYPVFEGGAPVAIQRGAGMVVKRSDKRREYAASVFLKWFTALEQNIQFVSETGYLPVTNEAFGTVMETHAQSIENPTIKQLLQTAVTMHQDYEFYVPPSFVAFSSLGEAWEKEFKDAARQTRQIYLNLLPRYGSSQAAYDEAKAQFRFKDL